MIQDPTLKNENWDRFIPKFKIKSQTKKKTQIIEKKIYSPFPPENHQLPSKVDVQIETGRISRLLKQENIS